MTPEQQTAIREEFSEEFYRKINTYSDSELWEYVRSEKPRELMERLFSTAYALGRTDRDKELNKFLNEKFPSLALLTHTDEHEK